MKTAKYFVAFVDIMGFSQLVSNNIDTSEKVYDYLSTFITNANQFIDASKQYPALKDANISIFSDNILVSLKVEDPSSKLLFSEKQLPFVKLINTIQLWNIINNDNEVRLPVRGGIVYGDFCHEDNLLFGKALIDAYNIERKTAVYPRIIEATGFVDPQDVAVSRVRVNAAFQKVFGDKLDHEPMDGQTFNRTYQVIKDSDGLIFCNYLCELYLFGENKWSPMTKPALTSHKKYIEKQLGKYTREKSIETFKKYSWMKTYHNWFCRGIDEFKEFVISI